MNEVVAVLNAVSWPVATVLVVALVGFVALRTKSALLKNDRIHKELNHDIDVRRLQTTKLVEPPREDYRE